MQGKGYKLIIRQDVWLYNKGFFPQKFDIITRFKKLTL